MKSLRKDIFWGIDRFFNKGRIKKNYLDVKYSIENNHTPDFFKKRKMKITAMLTHAVSSTEFYKKYSDSVSLQDFPVIHKNLIRDHFDDFVSSDLDIKKCKRVYTSGSTGAPFSVLHDSTKIRRSIADTIFFLEITGYEMGQKLFYIKIWPDFFSKKERLKLWFKNLIPQSVFKLEDEDINCLIQKIRNDVSKKSFLGYSSSFQKICYHLDQQKAEPIDSRVTSVITMSEGLNEYTRKGIQKYFGVNPISRYSNNENGILAQQDPTDASRFIINSASYYIEVLDLYRDQPVKNGELGRIVVTDLFNYAMPMIRYDTGDVGVLTTDKNGVRYLQSIEGRKLDLIYNTKGDIVPSHLSYKLCKYGTYKQFQLIQYGEKDYCIKLNTEQKVDETTMICEFKGYFGKDASIKIEYVDEIPLLCSGKRKEVLNTFHTHA